MIELQGINLNEDDIILGVDFTNGKDKTVISISMTVSEFNEMKRLAEIGEKQEGRLALAKYSDEHLKELLEHIDELQRLAKIGEATELAYSNGYGFTLENDYGDIIDSLTRDELVNYVKE